MFRLKNKELKNICDAYEEKYSELYNTTMQKITDYKHSASDLRYKKRMEDYVTKEETRRNKNRHFQFTLEEVERLIANVEKEMVESAKDLDDDELLRRIN